MQNVAQQLTEQFMEQAQARKRMHRETPLGGGASRRDDREYAETKARASLYAETPEPDGNSRPQRRLFDRTAYASAARQARSAGRANARRETLARQARRETSGFYGATVENALWHTRAGRLQRQRNEDGALVRLS